MPRGRSGTGTDRGVLCRVFGAFPTGVVAVAALADRAPTGLAASSFVSVSLDPPLVSFCVRRQSRTWLALRGAERLGLSVLGAHQERASRQLSAPAGNRFAGLTWRATPAGAVILRGASAWFDCAVEQLVDAGDHELVLLRVGACDADPRVPPLVFHGSAYRRLEPECHPGP